MHTYRFKILRMMLLAFMVGTLGIQPHAAAEQPEPHSFQYQGKDLIGMHRYDVIGQPNQKRIRVTCPVFEAALPYAEDWVFILMPAPWLMYAQSGTLNLTASITVEHHEFLTNPEIYLKVHLDQLSKKEKLLDPRIVTARKMPYLVYSDALARQTRFWWMYPVAQSGLFQLHFSTAIQEKERLLTYENMLADLAENDFKLRMR